MIELKFSFGLGYCGGLGFNPLKVTSATLLQWLYNSTKLLGDNYTSPSTLTDTSTTGSYRPVQPARGYLFDGVDDYVTTSIADNPTTSLRITCYANPTNFTTARTIVGKGTSTENDRGYGVYFELTTGKLVLYVSDTGLNYRTWTTTNAFTAGQTHKIDVTYTLSGAGVVMYVNDVLQSGSWNVAPTGLYNSVNTFDIGVQNDSINRFVGNIYDVKLYYDGVLKAQYKTDEGAGTIAYDSSGNGNHGTITNATLSTFHTTFADGEGADYQNTVGYTNNAGVLIPRNEANPTQDVLGNPLQYSGRVPYNASLVQSNALSLNGTTQYIQLPFSMGNTNNFRITGYFSATTSATVQVIISGRDTVNDGLLFQKTTSNTIQLFYNATSITTVGTYGGSVIYPFDISCNGTTLSMTVGTETVSASITGNLDAMKLIQIGADGNALYLNGKVFGFKFINNGVTIAEYPVSGGLGATVYDVTPQTITPQLVSNGAFDTDIAGWQAGALSATPSWSSGKIRVTHTGTAYGSAYIEVPTVIGKLYRATATYLGGTSNGWFIKANSSNYGIGRVDIFANIPTTPTQTLSGFFIATTTTTFLHVVVGPTLGTYAEYDNITLYEETGGGYHATAINSPTWSTQDVYHYNITKGFDVGKNRCSRSNEFTLSPWINVSTLVFAQNSIENPVNGKKDAWKISPSSIGSYLMDLSLPGATGTYTLSIYAKAGEQTKFQMHMYSVEDGESRCTFNLGNVTVSSDVGSTCSILSVGNGWYRCSLTQTFTGLTNDQIQPIRASTLETHNGVNGFYAYGIQLESGAVATAYQPTTGSGVVNAKIPSTASGYIPNGGTDIVSNPAGNFHNGAETDINRNPIGAKELINAGVALNNTIIYGDDFSLVNPPYDYKRDSATQEQDYLLYNQQPNASDLSSLAEWLVSVSFFALAFNYASNSMYIGII
jgi:hypothetical protein